MRVYGLIKIKFVFISKKYTPDYLTAWSLVRILFRECASGMSTPGLAMPADMCCGNVTRHYHAAKAGRGVGELIIDTCA